MPRIRLAQQVILRRVDYIDSPIGKVRIPDEQREGAFSDQMTVAWEGRDSVAIYFWRSTLGESDPDGCVGEVTGHVFMAREQFERLPASLTAMIEMREEHRDG